jgi:hypothetical protein
VSGVQDLQHNLSVRQALLQTAEQQALEMTEAAQLSNLQLQRKRDKKRKWKLAYTDVCSARDQLDAHRQEMQDALAHVLEQLSKAQGQLTCASLIRCTSHATNPADLKHALRDHLRQHQDQLQHLDMAMHVIKQVCCHSSPKILARI